MFMAREVLHCNPGKVRPLVDKFSELGKVMQEMGLDPFRISKTLVSNREFLAFLEDGGYGNDKLWSFRGRAWLKSETKITLDQM